MSTELVMPSNNLILCHPLLLPPSIFPSIRVISNESGLRIRWPKYWSFSFNISPSNEYPGLISFRMDWLDLLAAILFSLVLYSTILFSFYILYSHQQCTSVPISPHLCQHTDLCVCVSVCVCVLNSHPNDSGDQS